MKCPKCEFESPDGFKFCGSCGETLASPNCPNCGAEIPSGFKFCGQCGTATQSGASAQDAAPPKQAPAPAPPPPAAAPAPAPGTFLKQESQVDALRRMQSSIPEQLVQKIERMVDNVKEVGTQRRIVTVLFSDVSGFTAMSEKMDPEEVRTIMNDCFQGLASVIYKYEGYIDKFIGDAIMALFGAPLAHENDPELAIRAALEMQEWLGEFSERLEEKTGIKLAMRVGINTGVVIAGEVGSDLRMEYTVMGDTVNLASRLEHAAPVGGILVSHGTYRFSQKLFDFKAIAPLDVKGKEKPVPAYLAQAVKADPGKVRGLEGIHTPTIGRQQELETLKQAANAFLKQKKGSTIALIGRAGLGKSRLTEEVMAVISEGQVSSGIARCLNFTRSTGYYVLAELLRSLLGLDQEELSKNPDILRESLSAYGLDSDEVVPYLGNILSVEEIRKQYSERLDNLSPERLKEQTFVILSEFLEKVSEKASVFLVIEDLHWCDHLSMEFLEGKFANASNSPVLFLLNSRPPESGGNWPWEDYLDSNPSNVKICLSELDQEASEELLARLIPIKEFPSALKQSILSHSEGNPFYLEELLRMLMDQEVIVRKGKQFEVTQALDDLEVPETLQGLILARFDRFQEEYKRLLQHAAVTGRSFKYVVLSSIVDMDLHFYELPEILKKLIELEVLMEESKQNDLEYTFIQMLIQETIYQTLPLSKRKELHKRIGNCIENLYGHRTEEYLELLANHFSQGEEYSKALPYLIMAGKKAQRLFNNEEAIDFFKKAVEVSEQLAKDDSSYLEQKSKAIFGQAEVYFNMGLFKEAVTFCEEYLGLSADKELPPNGLSNTYQLLGKVAGYQGAYDEAINWLEKGKDVLRPEIENDEDRLATAHVLINLGWINYHQGNYDEALDFSAQGLELVKTTNHLNEIALATNNLGIVSYDRGEWEKALEYYEETLSLVERIGSMSATSALLNNMALIYSPRGDTQKAIDSLERALKITERMGDKYGIAVSHLNLGVVYQEGGKHKEAAEELEMSMAIAEELDAKDLIMEISNSLAENCMVQGALEQAFELIERSLVLNKEVDLVFLGAQAGRVKGEILWRQEQIDQAIDHLKKSLTLFQEQNNQYELAKTALTLGTIMCSQDSGQSEGQAFLDQASDCCMRLGIQIKAN